MRVIDPQKIADEELDFHEAHYLFTRGKLPKGYPMPEDPRGKEDPDIAMMRSKVTPLEDQEIPSIEANGGITDEEEEEDYDVGWNNNQRRAELARRGLSVEGDKPEMMARLRRDDVGESLPEDASTVG